MLGHVWSPHSVVDNSLSEVPLLEEITSVFLMTWMNLGEVLHLSHKISLFETLVDQKIIFCFIGAMATLACSLEHLETSSQSCGVVGIPSDFRWPVVVTMPQTNGVELFFITLDTVGSTDIISK
jgi:hypothetical protein